MPRNRLQPGQHTIDSAKIKPDPRGGYRMAWSIRLPDGLTLKRDTRGRMSKGELRAKARRQAEELMATYGRKVPWTAADLFGKYVADVAANSMEDSPRLRENTRARYALCLKIAIEELGEYPIADALRPDTFGKALRSIAENTGPRPPVKFARL